MGRFVRLATRDLVGRDVDRVERATSRVSHGSAWDGIASLSLLSSSSDGGAGLSPLSYPSPSSSSSLGLLPDLLPEQEDDTFAVQSTLPEVEDRRRFTFDLVPPLRKRSGTVVRLRTAAPVRGVATVPHGVTVEAKDDVILCIRRRVRRAVLLARGKGGGNHRPPKRTPDSNIWC